MFNGHLPRLFVVLSVLFVLACSEQPGGTGGTNELNTKEQPFDLAQVLKDYQGQALKVVDIAERSRQGRNAIAITLSVPLDPSIDHSRFFSLADGDDQNIEDVIPVLSKSGKVVWFDHIEPSSEYSVSVKQGLTAANGQSLQADQKDQLQTRRLDPSVSFATNGSYLSKGLSQGLPIQAVNVAQVNIDFFRIDDNNIDGFLEQVDSGYYYWNIERLTSQGKLVYSGRYDLQAPVNTRVERQIELSNVDELSGSGIYFAVMHQAGKYDDPQQLWFAVTDLGLHLRQYQGQLEVHVSSLKTGEAKADIEVSLYARQQQLIKTQRSDHQGVAKFLGMGENVALVVARAQGEIALVQMGKPGLDLSAFDLGQRPQLPQELFLYSARDLFRPGEGIDFNGLIRTGDGQKLKAPVLNARITRPNGAVAHQFRWQPQQLGYYHYHWNIPADAGVGQWQLEVSGPFEQLEVYPFKVEEFMPERMRLSFAPGKTQPVIAKAQEQVRVPVLGEYLYGAPAANNRLGTMVQVKHWRSPIKSLESFEFGDITAMDALGHFYLDDLNLDSTGQGEVVVPVNWGGDSPLRIELISSLFESGGRPVTRSYSALMWPKPTMLGIASRYPKLKDHDGPKENSRVKFAIVNASVDGQLYSAKGVEVRLIKEDRQYFWVYDNHQGWHYSVNENEYVVMEQSLNIPDAGEALVEFGVEYGAYRVEIIDRAKGLKSSVRFHAGEDWYARWQTLNDSDGSTAPDKISLALDKAHYQNGDIAQLTLVSPSAGEALIMVEGDGPLWMKRISVSDQAQTLAIPIDKDWSQHNLYVSAMVLRPGDVNAQITPKRSFGLIHLPLSRQDRRLELEIDIADQLLPQQKVRATVKISGEQADKGPVYVTLAAVDAGVLSISNFATPDPYQHFFGQRRYAVRGRDIYDQLIELSGAQKAQLRFGGDQDQVNASKPPKADVKILSIFKLPVESQHGVANFELDLPDFNGQVRLMAVAFSENSFGSADKHVTVAAPVVTQLAMPRFLAMGDEAMIALDLNNLTDTEQHLQLRMAIEGPVDLISSGAHDFSLAAKQKKVLSYRVKARGFEGQAKIRMMANGIALKGQSSQLYKNWKLAVRPAYPAIMTGQQQVLSKGQTFELALQDINQFLPSTLDTRIILANKADFALGEQLQHLLQYPYGCLEQTASRAYVLTHADSQNQEQMRLEPLGDKQRLKRIKAGIDRISALQLHNGGFGLWSDQSPEEHWLGAYVSDFLVSAQNMGVEVPYELLSGALERMSRYLRQNGSFVNQRYSEDNDNYTFAYKAYAGYVLSRVNRASLSRLRLLYDKQRQDGLTGLSKLHLGLALHHSGDRKRGFAAIKQGIKAIKSEDRQGKYYGDYGSVVRDKALFIHLLLSNNLFIQQAQSLSFELAKDIRAKQWFSTQERNALFLAGVALAKHSGESWQASLFIGLSEFELEQSGRFVQRISPQQVTEGVRVEAKQTEPLFVQAKISGYSKVPPAPLEAGLGVKRQWFDLQGQPINPSQIICGDLVVVRLQLTAKNRTPDALVVDLLPAGFEPENQNLAHGVKLADLKIAGKTLAQWQLDSPIKYQAYRDDRFVAAVDLPSHGHVNVFYLIRAVTPGVYMVPPALIEDMYDPKVRGIGKTMAAITVVAP